MYMYIQYAHVHFAVKVGMLAGSKGESHMRLNEDNFIKLEWHVMLY